MNLIPRTMIRIVEAKVMIMHIDMPILQSLRVASPIADLPTHMRKLQPKARERLFSTR